MRSLAACFLATLVAFAQEVGPRNGRQGPPPRDHGTFRTEVPTHPGSVVLGRPTSTSVTVSLRWHAGTKGTLVWGRDPAHLPRKGRPVSLRPGEPLEVVLDGLSPNTAYAYALVDSAGRRLLPMEGSGRFHTARAPGHTFTFTLTADPHLDEASDPVLLGRALANAADDRPDFHLDLGDTFMTEKHASRETAATQYAAQRYWFGQLGAVAPLFLVLGNHDGEGLDRRGQVPPDGLAAWAHARRTRDFPNPAPDSFYAGNAEAVSGVGLLRDYYAWTWGDARFIVLDPYWFSTPTRGGREPWNFTLGEAQYRWLDQVLKGPRTRYTFVFIHQLTGSNHPAGRGGAEASTYQEWGGRDLDGQDTFAVHRPGWHSPIHQLLVDAGVTAVFHGHDHFYARQERDGIVYQLVPQPGNPRERNPHAEEYGYRTGTFLSSSGHLRVRITPEAATVDYVHAALPDARDGARNGEVVHSYRLVPRSLP